MGHVALQRVLVRMLYDPDFTQRVYAGSETALVGLDLSADERGWLVASDARAYGIDPLRRSRSLTGLFEEYLCSCALVYAETGSTRTLDAFFSSALFHDGMQAGRSMAIDFGDYLEAWAESKPWLRALIQLERALVRARRGPEHCPPAPGRWRLSRWAELVHAPAGTLPFYQSVQARLRGAPQRAVRAAVDEAVVRAIQLPSGPTTEIEALLTVRAPEDEASLRVEAISVEIDRLLGTARSGCAREDLIQCCLRLNLSREDAIEVIDSFVASGELVAPSS